MTQMSVKIIGINHLVRVLGRDWPKVFDPHVRKLGGIAFDFAKLVVPKRTYKLHDSLKLKRVRALTYHVTEGAKHGKILRHGSPPHPIFPRFKKALFWPGLARPVAHVRRHPGFRANQYNETAATLTRSRADRVGKEINDDVVRIIG